MKEERHILSGASAARLLTEACGASLDGDAPRKLEIVRDLALDLERHLEGIASENPSPGLLAEAAQKCADLATLAACNAEALETPDKAAETVRLAADATEALSRMVEETSSNDLARRDARSASWKASLAARQMEDVS